VWISPIFDKNTVFLNRSAGLTFGVLALVFLSYFFIDRPLALYMQSPPWLISVYAKGASALCNPSVHVFFWLFAFYALRFMCRLGVIGNRMLFFALAVVVANVTIGPMKVFFGRMRPELFLQQHLYGFDFFSFHYSDLSFPSGHATTIAALAGAIACFKPRYSWHCMGVAFLLGFSRVILNKHYLSDVFMGTYMGLIVGQTVYLTMKLDARRS